MKLKEKMDYLELRIDSIRDTDLEKAMRLSKVLRKYICIYLYKTKKIKIQLINL